MGASHRVIVKMTLTAFVLAGSLSLVSCDSDFGLDVLFGTGPELSASVPADSPDRANPGHPIDTTPKFLQASQPGIATNAHAKATLDYSNASEGYICVMSHLVDKKVMVVVTSPDGLQYKYAITQAWVYTTIPLSAGNGNYQIDVFENLYENSYVPLFVQYIDVTLDDANKPFLYANPCVSFSAEDQVVQLSQQLAANATTQVEVVEQIYMYVVENISYDYEKAETVAPGYLPNNAETLRTKTGICFDYASLAASMLRAQGLPTKLVVGYCGEAYHAWIDVYTDDAGWIRKQFEFPGGAYVRLDPTFDSAGQRAGAISRFIGDGSSYQPIFYY